MACNYGHAGVYRGRIEGDRLVFEEHSTVPAPVT
jgi:hypothetical protein